MTAFDNSTLSDFLLIEIRTLVEDARRQVARAANGALTLTYWRIGKRLLAENLIGGRAEYGQRILVSLAQELEREFGKGFSYSALTRMARFAEQFPEERILVSLIQELTWTHFLALLPLKDALAREFYAEMCRVERWSVRALRQKIDGMLFERTAWEIGRLIVALGQGGKDRARYGEALIKRLADDLTKRFGRGFRRQNLWQMRQFHACWPIPQTVSGELQDAGLIQTLSRQTQNLDSIAFKSGNLLGARQDTGMFLAHIYARTISTPCLTTWHSAGFLV